MKTGLKLKTLIVLIVLMYAIVGCGNKNEDTSNAKDKNASSDIVMPDDEKKVNIEIEQTELLELEKLTDIEGFALEGVSWSQVGIMLNQEQKDLLIPGSVVQITYTSDSPIWLVAMSSFENMNPNGLIIRAIDENTYENEGYIKLTNPEENIYTIQFPYELLEKYFGSNFKDYLMMLQCEGSSDWVVYSLAIGMRKE